MTLDTFYLRRVGEMTLDTFYLRWVGEMTLDTFYLRRVEGNDTQHFLFKTGGGK